MKHVGARVASQNITLSVSFHDEKITKVSFRGIDSSVPSCVCVIMEADGEMPGGESPWVTFAGRFLQVSAMDMGSTSNLVNLCAFKRKAGMDSILTHGCEECEEYRKSVTFDSMG